LTAEDSQSKKKKRGKKRDEARVFLGWGRSQEEKKGLPEE